ncbi:unnamed protein product [Coregonus sp. 'balchen']|nr:unnamed protein product [Coregonus sp. 'balchen']
MSMYVLQLTQKETARQDARDILHVMLGGSGRLHPAALGQEEQEPGEQFEIRYKLLQLTNMDEGNQLGTVNNLLAQRCYEFTVKQADAYCLLNCYLLARIVLVHRNL